MLDRLLPVLGTYRNLDAVHRVEDNLLRLVFDKREAWFFDLSKGDSLIYPAPENYTAVKRYNSPFDVQLHKRISGSKIAGVSLLNDDKILAFDLTKASKYKAIPSRLIIEVTGKITNAILVDEKGVIAEALRHVDEMVSVREVRVGKPYRFPPKAAFVPKPGPEVEDIGLYLRGMAEEREGKRRQVAIRSRTSGVEKKMAALKKELDRLEDEGKLEAKAAALQADGTLLLSQIHKVRPYQKVAELEDYDGTPKTVALPEAKTPAMAANLLFKQARRLKNRAANTHIERENLESKLLFLERLKTAAENVKDERELAVLFPKREQRRKEDKAENVEVFYVEGYRIMLGKNEKGNVQVLKDARASDLWFHLKDRPSCHVIVQTDKQQVPDRVITEAARLCARFSGVNPGKYLVDYTKRRQVRIQERANVLYTEYDTITAEI